MLRPKRVDWPCRCCRTHSTFIRVKMAPELETPLGHRNAAIPADITLDIPWETLNANQISSARMSASILCCTCLEHIASSSLDRAILARQCQQAARVSYSSFNIDNLRANRPILCAAGVIRPATLSNKSICGYVHACGARLPNSLLAPGRFIGFARLLLTRQWPAVVTKSESLFRRATARRSRASVAGLAVDGSSALEALRQTCLKAIATVRLLSESCTRSSWQKHGPLECRVLRLAAQASRPQDNLRLQLSTVDDPAECVCMTARPGIFMSIYLADRTGKLILPLFRNRWT